MKNPRAGEIYFLISLAVFSLIYYFRDISPLSRNIGSKYYFLIIFIGLIVIIGFQVIKNVILILRERSSKKSEDKGITFLSRDGLIKLVSNRMVFVILSLLILIYFIPILGFFTSSFLFLVAVLLRFNIKKKNAIVISAIYSVSIYFIFEILLSISFPKGILF